MSTFELFNNEVNSEINLASAATKAQRAKFKFPSSDPVEQEIVDNRTPEQKMSDIVRIWSQCLTSEETKVWNEVSERDILRDISLKSGLRTSKSIIDQEIKKFRGLKPGKKSELLSTLNQLPSESFVSVNYMSQPADPTDIPSTAPLPFCYNESSAVSSCNQEFIAKYSKLLSKIQVENPIIDVQSDSNYNDLKSICATQVLNVRDQFNNRVRLQKIFRNNDRLLFQYMLLLKTHCTLTRRIASAFIKLSKW